MQTTDSSVGSLLRAWRERRGMSQLTLALDAGVSARHLSFVETGRAQPGRELILRVLEELDVPLRERNAILAAAGFAPTFRQRPFDDPSFDAVRGILKTTLTARLPFPAYVIDRHWNVAMSNYAVPALYEGVAEELMRPPVNVIRMLLHSRGFGDRLLNRGTWRTHLLAQLRRQAHLTGDPDLEALLEEALAYPHTESGGGEEGAGTGVVVPLDVMTSLGRLSFIGATTVFGAPADVTLEEIALEMLYPADEATERAVRSAAAGDDTAAKAPPEMTPRLT
jgi:transcriptional regulator with XRE-family HTH domain